MELFNLLSNVDIVTFGNTYNVYLNWIGTFIRFLITGVGSVGIGIILFSLVLKVIVLPFDVYQRVAMRKQNIKMKENQAKMEKLQKQYANNKDLYNQKVMEMYKESGFSMFSSCLPMILSIIIFIVAINAFNAYAQYSNIENYNLMVDAYNEKIVSYAPEYLTAVPGSENDYVINLEVAKANPEIKAAADKNLADGKAETEREAYALYFKQQAQLAVKDTYKGSVSKNTGFLWIKNIWATDASYKHPVLEYNEFKTEISQEKFSVDGEKYSHNKISELTNAYKLETYEEVTGMLDKEKSQANGWYVLIALSIGTILLQQFITQRSQKEQQKYSTVDGQGATQQKTMMIVMTGMFAIFAFMYSSAFSIYMITSNVFSMISTVVINKIVDVNERKKEEKALQEKHNQRFPGRKREEGKNAKKK